MLDTILSAIHNKQMIEENGIELFMICVRYDFVSYSQQAVLIHPLQAGCLWYVLDTILSAIHNQMWCPILVFRVVYDMC